MTEFLPRLERETFDRIATKGVTLPAYRTTLLDGASPIAALALLATLQDRLKG